MKEVNEIFDDLEKNLGVVYKNHVVIILDSSGSMESMKKEAVDMYNEQIKALKESSGNMETYVSFITFGTKVNEPIIWCGNINDVREIELKDYNPLGGTALYDAVGTSISKLLKRGDSKDKNTSYLFLIITDGEENSSAEYDGKKISSLIKKVQKTKRWTFTYLGTTNDLSKVKDVFNLSVGNTRGYTGVSEFNNTVNVAYNATVNYMNSRAQGTTAVDNYYSGSTTTPISSSFLTLNGKSDVEKVIKKMSDSLQSK